MNSVNLKSINTGVYPLWAWLEEHGQKVPLNELEEGGIYIFTQIGKEPDIVTVNQEQKTLNEKEMKDNGLHVISKKNGPKVLNLSGKYSIFYEIPKTSAGGKRRSKKTRKARKTRKGTYRRRR
jgi:hypothetical protein